MAEAGETASSPRLALTPAEVAQRWDADVTLVPSSFACYLPRLVGVAVRSAPG